jgi:GNAT superfamily N-acetyltransferase
MSHMRRAQESDIRTLQDMDIKCNEDDWWSEEDWLYRLQFAGTLVMCHFGEPIAFIAVDALNSHIASVVKLVVRPRFRRLRVASQLIADAEVILRERGYDILRLYVPDRRLDPRKSDDLSAFVIRNGFRASIMRTPEGQQRGVNDIAIFEKVLTCCEMSIGCESPTSRSNGLRGQ